MGAGEITGAFRSFRSSAVAEVSQDGFYVGYNSVITAARVIRARVPSRLSLDNIDTVKGEESVGLIRLIIIVR